MWVNRAIPFSITTRIKAYTMSKDAYLTHSIKVCGAETLAVPNSAARKYNEGVQTVDPSTLSEADRYLTIPQSEFE
jgi:hypothetical protein